MRLLQDQDLSRLYLQGSLIGMSAVYLSSHDSVVVNHVLSFADSLMV